ncbi:unnamed protein product [Timema podura]|uniref:Uncharacterized protein n=1 Tax=Timema podura TaxID=61482 RepID=A0ABN7PLD0_TIMPD|nr:unnamed protein product [Timema podura]
MFQVCHVEVIPDLLIAWDDSPAPAGNATLLCVGYLSPESNIRHTAALSEHLFKHLGIASDSRKMAFTMFQSQIQQGGPRLETGSSHDTTAKRENLYTNSPVLVSKRLHVVCFRLLIEFNDVKDTYLGWSGSTVADIFK